MPVRYSALPTDLVEAWRTGAPDAHGRPPERHISSGGGAPCRHCLRDIPEGAGMLILAHRPFEGLHPYAEVGPIFLCADACRRHPDADAPPEMVTGRPRSLVKGYGADDRIVYGTGAIVTGAEVGTYAAHLLERPEVAYLHVRSALNNCYFLRVDRG